jgi:hypothetical protein
MSSFSGSVDAAQKNLEDVSSRASVNRDIRRHWAHMLDAIDSSPNVRDLDALPPAGLG